MKVMKAYSVRILVEDFAECFKFYRDVIGLKPVWGDEDGPYADFQASGDTMLALFDRQLMAEAIGTADLPSTASAQDRSLVVFQVSDVDAVYRSLSDKGAVFLNAPKDYPGWTIRAVHLRDPDGNLLELFSPLARDDWTEEAKAKDEATAVTKP